MKKLIVLVTLATSISAFAYRGPAASSSSSGKTWGAYFEPYLGYEQGNYITRDNPASGSNLIYDGKATAFIGGAKVGLKYQSWFLGADISTLFGGALNYTLPSTTQPRDIVTRDLTAINLGYTFGRLKIWGTTFITNKFSVKNDVGASSYNDYSGTGGYGMGAGYQFSNHMAFNLEYHYYVYDELVGSNSIAAQPLKNLFNEFSSNAFILNLSFPFSK